VTSFDRSTITSLQQDWRALLSSAFQRADERFRLILPGARAKLGKIKRLQIAA
jgi:hypothetical protein